jgi:hypothetical protein
MPQSWQASRLHLTSASAFTQPERYVSSRVDSIARRHFSALDHRYLDAALGAVCDLAEDLAPRSRLDDVLRKASGRSGKR